jgi:hypothetical protein
VAPGPEGGGGSFCEDGGGGAGGGGGVAPPLKPSQVKPTGPKCTFNIKINNKSGVTDDQLKAAENQIQALFGPSVGVNFVNSGGADFSLNMVNAGPNNSDFGDQTGFLFFQGSATVNTNNISKFFTRYGYPSVVGMVFGTVGTHELVHRILGIQNRPFGQNSPNDLMSVADNPNAGEAYKDNTLQLTDSDKQQLLNKCQQKHGG